MRVWNRIPLLLECLARWERPPGAARFRSEYAEPMRDIAGGFFDDFHEVLEGLDWQAYRREALGLDPVREEARVRAHLTAVEQLFGFELSGDVLVFGAFTAMDGFARYEPAGHTVFLGVDESHGRGRYLDVLITHELTHVARETRPEVWTGWGLPARMTRSQFLQSMPVVEHLMNEGLSCAVSEILVPGEGPWAYAYQDPDSLARVLEHGPAIDRVVHAELSHPDGDYGRLYNGSAYSPRQGSLAHYVWAWQWTKHVLAQHAHGDPRKLVSRCSREFVEDALRFQLRSVQ
jgi:hypothetical protein